jgi:adhesin HecA-like repeat protein
VGFPPGVVVGATHLGDLTAAAAKSAVLAAYNDAAGRLGAAVLPADLSGLTLAPGLYSNSSSVMIAAGNLTLDAQGDSNGVFIFQVSSTLTTLAGTQVILAGGAKATNIYWAVGTSATLGTNSVFKGTILAGSALTMATGAVLEGRLLAQGAAVALDTNLITVPGP